MAFRHLPTVEELRRQGIKAWASHHYPAKGWVSYNPDVYANNGYCVVHLENEETKEEVARGYSVCSAKDSYNRRLAFRIALGRALAARERGTTPEGSVPALLPKFDKHYPGGMSPRAVARQKTEARRRGER